VSYTRSIIIAYFNDEISVVSIPKLSEYLEGDSADSSSSSSLSSSVVTHTHSVFSFDVLQLKLNASESTLYLVTAHSIISIDLDIFLAGTLNDQLVTSFEETVNVLHFLPSLTNATQSICLLDDGALHLVDAKTRTTEIIKDGVTATGWFEGLIVYSNGDSNISFYDITKCKVVGTISIDMDSNQKFYSFQQISEDHLMAVSGTSIDAEETDDFTTYFIKIDNATYTPSEVKVTSSLFAPYGVIPRKASFYTLVLNNWSKEYPNMAIAIGSKSTDFDLFFPGETTELLNDSDRAIMPLDDETGDDDTPIGIVLDLNSTVGVKEPCKGVEETGPLPRVIVLTNRGQLVIWNVWSKNDLLNDTANLEKARETLTYTHTVPTEGAIQTTKPVTTTDTNQEKNAIPDIGGLSFGSTPSTMATVNPFGSTNASIFGNADSTKTSSNPFGGSSPFGSTSPLNQQKPLEQKKEAESNTPSIFGAPKETTATTHDNVMGSSFGNSFGGATTNSSNTAFGGSSFGASMGGFKMGGEQKNEVPTTTTTTTTTAAAAFGSSSFGGSTFGGNGFKMGMNNSTTTQATTSSVGSNSMPAKGGFGGFATGSAPFANLSAKAPSNGSPFGSLSSNTATMGNSPFGNLSSKPAASSSPFGSLSSKPATGSSPFGSLSSKLTTNSSPFGSLSATPTVTTSSGKSDGITTTTNTQKPSTGPLGTVNTVNTHKPNVGLFGSKPASGLFGSSMGTSTPGTESPFAKLSQPSSTANTTTATMPQGLFGKSSTVNPTTPKAAPAGQPSNIFGSKPPFLNNAQSIPNKIEELPTSSEEESESEESEEFEGAAGSEEESQDFEDLDPSMPHEQLQFAPKQSEDEFSEEEESESEEEETSELIEKPDVAPSACSPFIPAASNSFNDAPKKVFIGNKPSATAPARSFVDVLKKEKIDIEDFVPVVDQKPKVMKQALPLDEQLEEYEYDFELNDNVQLDTAVKKLLMRNLSKVEFQGFDVDYQTFLSGQAAKLELSIKDYDHLIKKWTDDYFAEKEASEIRAEEEKEKEHKKRIDKLLQAKIKNDQYLAEAEKRRNDMIQALKLESEAREAEEKREAEIVALEKSLLEEMKKEEEAHAAVLEKMLSDIEDMETADAKQAALIEKETLLEAEMRQEAKRRAAERNARLAERALAAEKLAKARADEEAKIEAAKKAAEELEKELALENEQHEGAKARTRAKRNAKKKAKKRAKKLAAQGSAGVKSSEENEHTYVSSDEQTDSEESDSHSEPIDHSDHDEQSKVDIVADVAEAEEVHKTETECSEIVTTESNSTKEDEESPENIVQKEATPKAEDVVADVAEAEEVHATETDCSEIVTAESNSTKEDEESTENIVQNEATQKAEDVLADGIEAEQNTETIGTQSTHDDIASGVSHVPELHEEDPDVTVTTADGDLDSKTVPEKLKVETDTKLAAADDEVSIDVSKATSDEKLDNNTTEEIIETPEVLEDAAAEAEEPLVETPDNAKSVVQDENQGTPEEQELTEVVKVTADDAVVPPLTEDTGSTETLEAVDVPNGIDSAGSIEVSSASGEEKDEAAIDIPDSKSKIKPVKLESMYDTSDEEAAPEEQWEEITEEEVEAALDTDEGLETDDKYGTDNDHEYQEATTQIDTKDTSQEAHTITDFATVNASTETELHEKIVSVEPNLVLSETNTSCAYTTRHIDTADELGLITTSTDEIQYGKETSHSPDYVMTNTNTETMQIKESSFEEDEVYFSKHYIPESVPLLHARGKVEYPQNFEQLPDMAKAMKKAIYDVFINFDVMYKNVESLNRYMSDQSNSSLIFHTLDKSANFPRFWRLFEIETLLQGAEKHLKSFQGLSSHYAELLDTSTSLRKGIFKDFKSMSSYQNSLAKILKKDNDMKKSYLNTDRPLPFENVQTRHTLREKIKKLQDVERVVQSQVLLLKSQIYPEQVVRNQRTVNSVVLSLQKHLYTHADTVASISKELEDLKDDDSKVVATITETEKIDSIADLCLAAVEKQPVSRISTLVTTMHAKKNLAGLLNTKMNNSRYVSL
jgi:hypothetical protein